MTSTVLVTGAGGFIGSHLAEQLVLAGHDVRALVRYNAAGMAGWLDSLTPDIRSAIDIVFGDIRDPHQMHAVVSGCRTVYHLAALIAIPYSYQAPASYVATNVGGTLNLLQAARDCGVERFVQTSTSEVYGSAQFVPISEAHPINAQSPYAATKIGADQMALSFHRSFELPVSVIRPFNTFGPRQSLRAIIPTIISQFDQPQPRVKLGALHPTRDFTFVRDTVAGFMAIAAADGAIGEVINIGSGFEVSIGALLNLIAKEIGVEPEVETDSQRVRPESSEVDRLWADVGKARRLLEWHPNYSGIEGFSRGLRETIQWFRSSEAIRSDVGRYYL